MDELTHLLQMLDMFMKNWGLKKSKVQIMMTKIFGAV